MKIAITGSTGFIGSELVKLLISEGHDVVRLVRHDPRADDSEFLWDPSTGDVDLDGLDGVEAVVHLAGENLAARRWSSGFKARIRSSRIDGTSGLCSTLAELPSPPRVLVAASAIGIYGHREEEVLTEESRPGTGFLAEVCEEWEAAAQPARDQGIRVVHLRIGMVVGPGGGALGAMLRPFKMGLGGRMGNGHQWWSWITSHDVARIITHAVATDSLEGPVNSVTPNPVTNREFTRAFAQVLGRPAFLPLPAPLARILVGEMADELLLASCRVQPARLLESGFEFQHPEIRAALANILR